MGLVDGFVAFRESYVAAGGGTLPICCRGATIPTAADMSWWRGSCYAGSRCCSLSLRLRREPAMSVWRLRAGGPPAEPGTWAARDAHPAGTGAGSHLHPRPATPRQERSRWSLSPHRRCPILTGRTLRHGPTLAGRVDLAAPPGRQPLPCRLAPRDRLVGHRYALAAWAGMTPRYGCCRCRAGWRCYC